MQGHGSCLRAIKLNVPDIIYLLCTQDIALMSDIIMEYYLYESYYD